MKIGIIVDSLDFNASGIGNYTSNLVGKLLEIDKENEYVLIHLKDNKNVNPLNVKDIAVRSFPFPPRASIRKNILIPKISRKETIDILHETSQITPILFHQHFKRVITIHDLIPLAIPANYYRGIYYKFMIGKAAKNSDKIIAPSEYSKKDISSCLKITEDKISVIPYGLDERYKVLRDEYILEKKYNLNFPFILYVGSFEKRKNVIFIINAFNILKKKGLKHKLLLVGGKDREYPVLSKTVVQSGLEDDVFFLGNISQRDLPELYNLADLFVFPSSYEGFGLPPLEAMACGTPVITSNMSSIPEVVGDAGIKIDPYNISEFADAIYAVLNDDNLKNEMIKKGLERAKLFSWVKAAKETLAIYEEIGQK